MYGCMDLAEGKKRKRKKRRIKGEKEGKKEEGQKDEVGGLLSGLGE